MEEDLAMAIKIGRTKKAQTRAFETIEFIKTAHVTVNGNRRQLVADQLATKYKITKQISQGMHQGVYSKLRRNLGQKKTNRKYRRACIAIRCAILGQTVAAARTTVGRLAGAALPGALGALLHQAYQHEIDDLNQQWNNFTANPANFLANHRIATSTGPNSGIALLAFYFKPNPPIHMIGPPTPNLTLRTAHILVNVYKVAVHGYLTVSGNRGAIVGDAFTPPPNVMVTDQLTGCSFMYQTNLNYMTAIHIMPGGPDGGLGRRRNLVTTLRANGVAFANANHGGVRRVFGNQGIVAQNQPLAYNYQPYRTTLIGVYRNGAWEVHAQAYSRWQRQGDANIAHSWKVS